MPSVVGSAPASASANALDLASFLAANLPKNSELRGLSVHHVVQLHEGLLAIARQHLPLTDVMKDGELAAMIAHQNRVSWSPKAGTDLAIPRVWASVPQATSTSHLGWPDDRALAGIYANAEFVKQPHITQVLDALASHSMNAIVVDVKDVSGTLTYPSDVALAKQLNATQFATVPSIARFIEVAHARNLRVIARIACFHDEWVASRRHDLAIQNKHGGAHRGPSGRVDWLDPQNQQVRSYLLNLVDEVIANGADEVQLDYVRYPTEGIFNADFRLQNKTTADVITDFVKTVHEHTHAHNVPLSLDVFGVVAWQHEQDTMATGQDLTRLAPFVEALSPMVYPSHFAPGFSGFDEPGDHPELVRIGTSQAMSVAAAANPQVVMRPWVQAFPWKSPHFGIAYILDQIREAKVGGGLGFLAWNSGGEYGATLAAMQMSLPKPRKAVETELPIKGVAHRPNRHRGD
jgi:hypothetical protein